MIYNRKNLFLLKKFHELFMLITYYIFFNMLIEKILILVIEINDFH